MKLFFIRTPIQKLSTLLLRRVNFNSDNEIAYSEFKMKCYKLFEGKFNCDTISLTLQHLKQKGYDITLRNKKNGNDKYRLVINAEFKS